MKRHLLFAMLMLALCISQIRAEYYNDFQVDNIYYKILTDKTNEVVVTLKSAESFWNLHSSGYYYNEDYDIVIASIPDKVYYNGITYNVTGIDGEAFRDCKNLVEVNIPNSVTNIGGGAFMNCTSLTSINIPNALTSIEIYTFYGCTSLTSVVLPRTLTNIGTKAFYNCTGLTSIYSEPATPPTLASDAFTNSTAPVYVADCALSTYQYAPTWKDMTITPVAFNLLVMNNIGGALINNCALGQLEAIEYEGYHFVKWQDGNKENPRPYSLTDQSHTYVAQFAVNKYQITLQADAEHGSVIGEQGTYDYESEHTIEAVANYGYQFKQWSDGNADNPRTIVLTQDTTLTAEFEPLMFSVVALSANETMGSVSGSGDYEYKTNVQLTATSAEGYEFKQWSDGVTDNPRNFVLIQDTTFTAEFAKIIVPGSTIETAIEFDPENGHSMQKNSVNWYRIDPQETNKVIYSMNLYINNIQTPLQNGNVKIKYYTKTSPATENPSYSLLLEESVSITRGGMYEKTLDWDMLREYKLHNLYLMIETDVDALVFADLEFINLYELALSCDDSMGTVSGSGVYPAGTSVQITATPAEGYLFKQWSDGVTDNPRTIVLTQDTTFTAEFEPIVYSVVATSADETMGTVSGSGEYAYMSEVELAATPTEGYLFKQWSDGNTDNPRTIVISQDTTLTAEFRQILIDVDFKADIDDELILTMYDVSVKKENGKYYIDLTDEQIEQLRTAIIENSYWVGCRDIYYDDIRSWLRTERDGYNYDERLFIDIDETNLSEIVEYNHNLTREVYVNFSESEFGSYLSSNSFGYVIFSISGSVYDNKEAGELMPLPLNCGSTIELTAVPLEGCSFVKWEDGSTENPRIIEVNAPLNIYAEFEDMRLTLSVESANTEQGAVTGGGKYAEGTTITVTATPAEGYLFKQWSDGNTNNPRTIVLTQDTTLTAEFELAKCIIASGTCGADGDNLTWELGCDSVMTISGEGKMETYLGGVYSFTDGDGTAPWRDKINAITTVNVEEGVTSIGRGSFADATNLREVNIGNTVRTIGALTFRNCLGLTSITMPDSIKGFGTGAFEGCENLTAVHISDLARWSWIKIGQYISIVANSPTPLYYAHHLYLNGEEIKDLILPDTLTHVAAYAFDGGSAFTSLNIPATMKSIDDYAFRNCSGLTSITCAAVNPPSLGSNVFQNVSRDIPLYVPAGTVEAYKVASTWREFKVKCLVDSGTCGANNDNLTWELSCDGVLTISGEGAMEDWISNGAPWKDYNDAITSVIIAEGVTNISYQAFNNLPNLVSLRISSTVTDVSDNPIYKCSNLKTIVVDSKNSVFDSRNNCNAIIATSTNKLVVGCPQTNIPVTVTWIGANAFRGSGLQKVVIPGQVTQIDQYAFSECSNLTSVTIPASVTGMEDLVFYSCPKLTAVTFKGITPPSLINTTTFCGWFNSTDCNVFVPCGTKDVYYLTINNKTDKNSINANKKRIGELPEEPYSCYFSFLEEKIHEQVVDDYNIKSRVSILGRELTYSNNFTILQEPTCDDRTLIIRAEVPNMYENNVQFVQWSDGVIENPRTLTLTQDTTLIALFEGVKFNVYVTSSDESLGTVTGTGTYETGSTVQISAIPIGENSFVQWSDGVTDNPRTLVLNQDTTFTAIFKKCIVVSGTCGADGDNLTWELSCDSVLTISGMGEMKSYSSQSSAPWYSFRRQINSVFIDEGVSSLFNYFFRSFNASSSNTTSVEFLNPEPPIFNGNSSSSYFTFYVPCGSKDVYRTALNLSSSATIETKGIVPYNYSISSENLELGDVKILTEASCDDLSITFRADANEGYKFIRWSDGNTDNPRTLSLTQDTILFAVIDVCPSYSFSSANSAFGSVVILTENPCEESSITFRADANEGYMFVQWSDGNTDNPRTVTLTQDTILLAEFDICSLGRGTCGADGDNLVWEISCDSVLTISGMGEMYHYSLGEALINNSAECSPFYPYRNVVKEIIIEEGVTSIGGFAFYLFNTIPVSITLPSTLTTIEDGAFLGCWLTAISIPYNVKSIGNGAFYYCRNMTSVDFANATPPAIAHNFKMSINDESLPCFAETTCEFNVPCGSKDAYVEALQVDESRVIEALPNTAPTYLIKPENEEYGYIDIIDAPTWPIESCDELKLTFRAVANNGYVFKQWSDGNTDNPRSMYLTRDTVITAMFACNVGYGYCGAQGDNLRWELNCDRLLTISGKGEMVNFNAGSAPWNQYSNAIGYIYISDSVTSIGDYAFYGCDVLESVEFKNTEAPYIGRGNFADTRCVFHVPCGSKSQYYNSLNAYTTNNNDVISDERILEETVIASGTCGAHGDNVIWKIGCDGTLTISGEGEMIGYSLEKGISRALEIDEEATMNDIYAANSQFYQYRTNIGDIVIEEGITNIGGFAFASLELHSISIPSTVKRIDDCAFICTIDSVFIPSTVTNIGKLSFGGLSGGSIRSVQFESSTPPVFDNDTIVLMNNSPRPYPAFMNTSCQIYVPCGSKDAYKEVLQTVRENRIVEISDSPFADYYINSASEEFGWVTIDSEQLLCDSTVVTFHAEPASGYMFKQWSDGNTDNPRTIVLTQDTTLTAEFEVANKTLTLEVGEPEMGTISGAGDYEPGSTVTIIAEPGDLFVFDYWTNGIDKFYENELSITLTQDTTFTAHFKPWTVDVTFVARKDYDDIGDFYYLNDIPVIANGSDGYTISLTEEQLYAARVALTTSPLSDCMEKDWSSDYIYEIGHLVEVSWEYPYILNGATNAIIIARTQAAIYEIWLESDESMGYIAVVGYFGTTDSKLYQTIPVECGSTIELTAVPLEGYRFKKWSDGSTDNPRSVVVDMWTSFYAEFEDTWFTLSAESADSEQGTVTGSGRFEPGSTVTITAEPGELYVFDYWTNGTDKFYEKELRVTLTQDTTFTAHFIPWTVDISAEVCNENTLYNSKECMVFYHFEDIPVVKNNDMYTIELTDEQMAEMRWSLTQSWLSYCQSTDLVYVDSLNRYKGMTEIFDLDIPQLSFVDKGMLTEISISMTTHNRMQSVRVESNDNLMGYAVASFYDGYGDGQLKTYDSRDYLTNPDYIDVHCSTEVTFEAIAYPGYRFVYWSNANADNSTFKEYIEYGGIEYIAIFEPILMSAELQMIYIGGTEVENFAPDTYNYTFHYPANTAESALPTVSDITWDLADNYQTAISMQAGNSVVISVTSGRGLSKVYVLTFVIDRLEQFTVTTLSNNDEWGTVIGGNTYNANAEVSIGAFAKDGYQFYNWNNSITDNPYSFTLTQDTSFVAMFLPDEADEIAPSVGSHSILFEWERRPFGLGYWLYIYLDKDHRELLCRVKFDPFGIPFDIEWGPAHNKAYMSRVRPEEEGNRMRLRARAAAAEADNLLTYTLENLADDTEHYFVMECVGEQNQVVEAHAGNVRTSIDITTDLERQSGDDSQAPRKIVKDGHVFILMPDGRMFDATGRQL